MVQAILNDKNLSLFRKGFSSSQSFTVGHPKLAKLDEVVLNHFKSIEGELNEDSIA